MTRTEQIAHLLKEAIAGRVSVSLDYDFDTLRHCDVPVTIDGHLFTFWMRESLCCIHSVRFSDGTAIDSKIFDAERWLPPRHEFPNWWTWMGEFVHATTEQLVAEVEAKRDQLRQANLDQRIEMHALMRRAQALDQLLAAEARLGYAYDPLHYLSDDERSEFEELLRKQSAGIGAKT